MSHLCPGYLMDPLEYNILVKLHTSAIEHRRDSIIKNIQWRQRTLERDNIGYYYTTPAIETDSSSTVERVTVETVHRVPEVCYWRDIVEYPKFLRRLCDTHIPCGRNGRLDVRATGNPAIEVQWYKDWHPIYSCDKFQINHFDPDIYELSINYATHEDQGLYSCRITNIAGSVNTSCFVHIDKDGGLCLCDVKRSSLYDNI